MFDLAPEDQNLINAIKESARDPKRRTLMVEKFGHESTVYPPVSLRVVQDAEKVLGLRFPALIREIYLQVGNGGFGPGYGIIGLEGGFKVYMGTLVQECLNYRAMRDNIALFGLDEPGWDWKHHYIVYGYWGCTVTTIIDCEIPSLSAYSLDGFTLKPHSSPTLRQWWSDWLEGKIRQY